MNMEKIIIKESKLQSLRASLTNHVNMVNTDELSNTRLQKLILSLVKNDENRAKKICIKLKWIRHKFGKITTKDIVDAVIKNCVMIVNDGNYVKMKRHYIIKLQTTWED